MSALTSAYNKQQQDLSSASVGAVASQIIQDLNGQAALAMNVNFGQSMGKIRWSFNLKWVLRSNLKLQVKVIVN